MNNKSLMHRINLNLLTHDAFSSVQFCRVVPGGVFLKKKDKGVITREEVNNRVEMIAYFLGMIMHACIIPTITIHFIFQQFDLSNITI